MSEKDLYTVLTVDVETEDGVEAHVVVHGVARKDSLHALTAHVAESITLDHQEYLFFDGGEYDTVEEAVESGYITEHEAEEARARYDSLTKQALGIADAELPYGDVRFEHPKDGFTVLVIRPADEVK